MEKSRGRIGVVAVVLGMTALAFAIIPRAIFDVPPPWSAQKAPEPQLVPHGGATIKWKDTEITVFNKTKVVHPPPAPPPSSVPKAFFITTAVIALIGIAVGLIAAWYERSYLLGGPAVAMCSIALLWHYILIGVVVAVACLIIVLILASLAG